MNYRQQERTVPRPQARMPRSRYSHLSDEEFSRMTQFEAASEELLEEYRARFRPARGQ